jgi:hypothetical protein
MIQNKETIEQSMLAQQVYLDIVRGRHLRWAGEAQDPELKRYHTRIAGLLEQVREEYYELLSACQAPEGVCVLDLQDQSVESQLS